MEVTRDVVDYLADLAKLELTGEEKKKVEENFKNMLEFFKALNQLDTASVEPMSHAMPLKNVFREDKVLPSLDRQDILSNTKYKKNGCFVVPKTLE